MDSVSYLKNIGKATMTKLHYCNSMQESSFHLQSIYPTPVSVSLFLLCI
jgi:hypothetical protein